MNEREKMIGLLRDLQACLGGNKDGVYVGACKVVPEAVAELFPQVVERAEKAEREVAALQGALDPGRTAAHRDAVKVLVECAEMFAKIEVPDDASDGTWVATTTFCGNQVTAYQVRRLQSALDAVRRAAAPASAVASGAVSEGANHSLRLDAERANEVRALRLESKVLEAIKRALGQPGVTGSYVEWARYLRTAHDVLLAEVRASRDCLDALSSCPHCLTRDRARKATDAVMGVGRT